MNPPAKKKTSSEERYERYKTVIDCVTQQADFELERIRSECAPEKSSFVTRVVNDLERHGWIVREDGDSSVNYRWNAGRGQFSASRWLDEKMFGAQIKESPEQDRPRERLLALGTEQMTDSELLAILIRSGRPGESAVIAGSKLARTFEHRLHELSHAGRAELKDVSPAIEKTAYCQIMAGIELGRRVTAATAATEVTKIRSSGDAMTFCQRRFARLAADRRQEEFHIVTLDTKNQVIDTHQITVGTLDASLVHPREVFRPAIRDAAASVILVHNHPSGDPTPSREDFAATQRLEAAGEVIGIDILDHIVLGGAQSSSIRESR